MRFVNADGRAGFLVGEQVFDIATLSNGSISADPMRVVTGQWRHAVNLHAKGAFDGGRPLAEVTLGPPVPAPRAVYGVGLNYRDHAAETGKDLPELPAVFTKFPTAITGPYGEVVLPAGREMVDYEAELCVVFADGGRHVPAAEAYDRGVLGVMCAQDLSERHVQYATGFQFSLGKSYPTFCPIGPAIVTLDELPDPAALSVTCELNGTEMQRGTTADLIFDVPALVEFISSICPLRAGDLCLTGTPAGVGVARTPPVFLRPGDELVTRIDGVGELRHVCVAES